MAKYDYFTESGKGDPKLNEDSVFANSLFGFVIDGATGYGSVKITDAETDAKWYSTTWKKYLRWALYVYNNRSLTEIMHNGLNLIIKKLERFKNYKKAEFPPSAAIAVFRKKGDKLEYFVLADCSLLIYFKNGTTKLITKNDIREIDEKNMELIKATAKKENMAIVKAKDLPEIKKVFVEMFKNRNTETGGWVLSNSHEAIQNANTGELELKNIKSVLGFSDGYSQIYELFDYITPEELAESLSKGETTLKDLSKKIRELQQKDPYCNEHPRTKIGDDSSAFIVNSKKEKTTLEK